MAKHPTADLTTDLFRSVIPDADLHTNRSFRLPRSNKPNELSPNFCLFFPQQRYSLHNISQQQLALCACLSSVARRQDGQSPQADRSNPGSSAAPLYFSAPPTRPITLHFECSNVIAEVPPPRSQADARIEWEWAS